ncbi:MAG TPA: MBL fold metallo-hydrolase [Methanoregulaceae archaeon]|nr:MBL fold metallo-hydrolase [Methanoregulaceae archaeon]HQN88964.1 MBL fold metallo-hydrolase [Methanoregulaceae archaeon]
MIPYPACVHPIRIPFTVPSHSGPVPRYVFSFLIGTKESLVLIDAGVHGSEQRIFGEVRNLGRKPEEIGLLVLTHSHPDHIGGAMAIQEATGCSVAAHPSEQKWIEDTQCQERERPVPGFRDLVGGPVRVSRLIGDGDSITLGAGRALQVIHTPGHSSGSISLLMRPEMILFSGDAIPVPGDLPIYDDPDASIESLERLMNIEHITYLFSSWAEPKGGEEVYFTMDDGHAWVKEVSRAVSLITVAHPGIGLDHLIRLVVKEIGLPPEAANPMVIRTIKAHTRKS